MTEAPPWLRDAAGRSIAVLGAGGFVGSRVVEMALAAGAGRVDAITTGDPWRLAGVVDPRVRHHALARWWAPDAGPVVAAIAEGADALVLLAYRPPGPDRVVGERLEHELTVNACGAVRVAAACARSGTRVVFTSSADVYGRDHPGTVGEDLAPRPGSPYAVAKLAAESGVQLVAAPAPAVSLRLSTVFGPGENGPRAIPSFIRALLAGERPVLDAGGADERDYVHVDDVAAAVVNACILDGLPPGPLNISSGIGRRTADILAAVGRVLGVRPQPDLPPADRAPGRLVLDHSRAAEVLGYRPSPAFEPHLAGEAEWLRRHLSRPPAAQILSTADVAQDPERP